MISVSWLEATSVFETFLISAHGLDAFEAPLQRFDQDVGLSSPFATTESCFSRFQSCDLLVEGRDFLIVGDHGL